jgi:hypothetical protein
MEVTNEEVASYLDSIRMHIKFGDVNAPELIETINSLPSPRKIRRNLSEEEAKIIFETVRWVWKEISGKDIQDTFNFEAAPENLMGNYWMIKNGLILSGINHYGIIKNNISLFADILKINPFLIHEKISGSPHQLIKLVIDHGGMRIFVDSNKKGFFQLNDKEYANWGRHKIKKLDLKSKTVKLIDPGFKYIGWKSGINLEL